LITYVIEFIDCYICVKWNNKKNNEICEKLKKNKW